MSQKIEKKQILTPLSLSMKAAERFSGVAAGTMRAWERRYQAVEPLRSGSGRREYSMKEVERLKTLRLLVDRGHTIGGIARLNDIALKKLLVSAGGDLEECVPSFERTRGSQKSLTLVLAALNRFDLRALEAEFHTALREHELKSFVFQVMAPLLIEIGLQVERGTLSIAQEHALSAMARTQLGETLRELSQRKIKHKWTIAFATPEGDIHEFGILLSALLAADQGFVAHFLGCNLPARDFASACQSLGAGVAVLGTSPLADDDMAKPLNEYLSELDQLLPKNCDLWMGGRGRCNMRSLSLSREIRQLGTLDAFTHALVELEASQQA